MSPHVLEFIADWILFRTKESASIMGNLYGKSEEILPLTFGLYMAMAAMLSWLLLLIGD
jgi:hypothetical protein